MLVLVAGLVVILLYVFQRLGVIESHLERNTLATIDVADTVRRQNGRVAKLEQWRWQIIGATLFLIAVAPFVFFALGYIPR